MDRYQVVTTWIGDCLRTGKPSRYTTNHQGQLSGSAFHLSRVTTLVNQLPASLAGV